jgi:hypothetical protein
MCSSDRYIALAQKEASVGILIGCLISIVLILAFALVALWTVKVRPMDARLSAAERHARELASRLDEQLGAGGAITTRVDRLDAFMRPASGEFVPRLAQLEQQQAVDSFAFAEQARINSRQIKELDTRLQYMAREMNSERLTVRPPSP